MAEQALPERPLLVLAPSKGWVSLDLAGVWEHRELLYFLTWRDVKVRYKQTALGVLWAIIQPLAPMLIFTLFFGRLVDVPADGSLSAVRLRGPAAVDILRQRRDQQRQQPRDQREPDHEGLLPADDHSGRGDAGGADGFRHRSRRARVLMVWYRRAAGTSTLLLLPLLVALTTVLALGRGHVLRRR